MQRDSTEIACTSKFEDRLEGRDGKLALVKDRVYGTENPVVIGAQARSVVDRVPEEKDGIKKLQCGKFVIVRPNIEWGISELETAPNIDLMKHPWIGKVVKPPDFFKKTVQVHWYKPGKYGQLGGVWYPELQQARDKTKNQPEIPCIDEIPLHSIQFFNFELNKGNKLSKKMIDSAAEVMKDFNGALDISNDDQEEEVEIDSEN